MRRGLILIGSAYAPETDQTEALRGGVDELRALAPMTCEDRTKALGEVLTDLGEGDELHVTDLAYLGHHLTDVVALIADLAERGVSVVVPGGLAPGALAAAATVFSAAARSSQLAQVTEFKARAASRRSATPPKCLFVPADLADC